MTTIVENKNIIQENDQVLICFEDDVTYLVRIAASKKLGIHRGRPIVLSDLIGKSYGEWIDTEHSRALLLEPTTEDYMMKVRRESGIIYPKDAAMLLMKLGIHSGSRVVEIGSGSGSLTIALAGQVAPEGKVYSYDVRDDFLKLAENNVKRANLLSCVEFNKRIGHEPFNETEVDAVISDVPEAWHEMEPVRQCLKNGGGALPS